MDPTSVEHWVAQQTGSAGRNGEKPLLIVSRFIFALYVGMYVCGQHPVLTSQQYISPALGYSRDRQCREKGGMAMAIVCTVIRMFSLVSIVLM